jgi:hypothetical protein
MLRALTGEVGGEGVAGARQRAPRAAAPALLPQLEGDQPGNAPKIFTPAAIPRSHPFLPVTLTRPQPSLSTRAIPSRHTLHLLGFSFSRSSDGPDPPSRPPAPPCPHLQRWSAVAPVGGALCESSDPPPPLARRARWERRRTLRRRPARPCSRTCGGRSSESGPCLRCPFRPPSSPPPTGTLSHDSDSRTAPPPAPTTGWHWQQPVKAALLAAVPDGLNPCSRTLQALRSASDCALRRSAAGSPGPGEGRAFAVPHSPAAGVKNGCSVSVGVCEARAFSCDIPMCSGRCCARGLSEAHWQDRTPPVYRPPKLHAGRRALC